MMGIEDSFRFELQRQRKIELAVDTGEMADDTDMGGAMTMQAVASVPVGAGETVSFQPGGLHVMLLGLVEPLEVGSEFDVILTFENAGDVVVTVEVRDDAPE